MSSALGEAGDGDGTGESGGFGGGSGGRGYCGGLGGSDGKFTPTNVHAQSMSNIFIIMRTKLYHYGYYTL